MMFYPLIANLAKEIPPVLIKVVPILVVIGVVCFMVYKVFRCGFKGALFGQAIIATCPEEVVYYRGKTKHTYRLHRLEQDDLYGVELARWAGPLGETTAIVIPRDELLKLKTMIETFVSEEQ